MKKSIKIVLAVACCLTLVLGSISFTACGKQDETYSIVYNLNYDGGATRIMEVPYGAKTTSWKADRAGKNQYIMD